MGKEMSHLRKIASESLQQWTQQPIAQQRQYITLLQQQEQEQ